jgi:DNA gyrase subunit A
MKLDEGDKLINVAMCDENNDIMLATRQGKCIRFPVTDVRVFVGRNSTGVRGIKLAPKDEVISMTMLKHIKAPVEERDEYLKVSGAMKKIDAESGETSCITADQTGLLNLLSLEKFEEMQKLEEFILSVTVTGYGKRSSSYEYRVTGRGGSGIANMEMSPRNKEVVSSFPITEDKDIMMVTDGGKLIRMQVDDIRIAGRKTQGVILFRTAENENVVSVTKLDADEGTDEEIDEENDNVIDSEAENADMTEEAVTEPRTDEADA